MKYLNQSTITELGTNWEEVIHVINQATAALDKGEVSQPVKPYLRYKNMKNRIIAMPAYIGGDFEVAGIKWIASFPDNIKKNIPRAHAVIILNEESTGIPVGIINTALISGIRTAGVTGAIVANYFKHHQPAEKINFGIIGFGPIGKLHLEMLISLFSHHINKVLIYDLNPDIAALVPAAYKDKVVVTDNWETVFDHSKVFMTCTVSSDRYIDRIAPRGSLQLNVSLRDYQPEFMQQVNHMVVDDWEEICRENTDIENMHLTYGLKKEDTKSIGDVLCRDAFAEVLDNEVVMFNPMGMAIFDMAIGKYYHTLAVTGNKGISLAD